MIFRILVVDDDRDVADTLTELFSIRGYEARTAYDGAQGLAIAKAFAPHVIVSDLNMPTIDGIELFLLTRKLPHAPEVILMSGNPKTIEIVKKRELQASVQVELKPIHPLTILGLVDSKVERLRA